MSGREERHIAMVDRVVLDREHSRVAAYEGDSLAGECTFEKNEAEWVITHTIVDPAYGGQKVGQRLVALAVTEARKDGVKILPVCSFARAQFDKFPEYRDVLSDKTEDTPVACRIK